eukprot:2030746-Prymnesium_polylepis.1
MMRADPGTTPLKVADKPADYVIRPHGPGPTDWMTVDGTPGIEEHTRKYGPPGSLVHQANMCNSSLRLPVHDWVMSLEVGEHLPTWCLANYWALLHHSSRRGLILSWSQVASGSCHINEKDPRYIVDYIKALGGYRMDPNHPCGRGAFHRWMRWTLVFHRAEASTHPGDCEDVLDG